MRKFAPLVVAALAWCAAASAAPFTVTLKNTGVAGSPDWSAGLLTLQVLLPLGLTPTSGTAYQAYAFTTSGCNLSDGYCSGSCNDNGNATVLAQRAGLTLGVNAWAVPALALGQSATVSIDAPVGSRLSYLAWVNDTSVIDDFVAMHEPGNTSSLSVPLFSGSTPLSSIDFEISGYDSNSVSATNGSSSTCATQCPPPASGCYVALGNATYGASGDLPQQPVAEAGSPTALSGNGSVKLVWTNAAPHQGVIIVRRTGAAVVWTPTAGQSYSVGSVGTNGEQIVYAEDGTTAASTFTDTSVTNGTGYYYRIYAFARTPRSYSPGLSPTSSGLYGTPSDGVSPNPRWCYSTGLSTTAQPSLEVGSGVVAGWNTGAVTSLNPDGTEKFRPVQVGTTGLPGRVLIVPLQGRTGTYIIGSSSSGLAYAINNATGQVVWTRQVATNSPIQAQPAVQLYQYSNPAFQAAHPNRDLIFFASRKSGGAAGRRNTVTALSSVDGSVVWTYNPLNMGYISGGMLVDRLNNRLFVASRTATNTGGTASVRVLDTLTGALVTSFTGAGNVDLPVAWGYKTNEAFVTATSGIIYAYSMVPTPLATWNYNPGSTQSAYAFPTGEGFISLLSGTGSVQRYKVDATTLAVTSLWTSPPAIAGPNGIRIDFTTTPQRAFVSSFSGGVGAIRQLNLDTGAIEKTANISADAVAAPMLDPNLSPKRLYVGMTDTRICSYDVPF